MKTSAIKGKILVIDDSSAARKIVSLTLERAGYEVIAKKQAVLVTSTIMREKPDVVLLDVNMPAIQGDKLVEIIRGHPAGAGTILLLYSVKPAVELEALAHQCGADGFIQKGADASLLPRQMDMWMGRLAARAEDALEGDQG